MFAGSFSPVLSAGASFSTPISALRLLMLCSSSSILPPISSSARQSRHTLSPGLYLYVERERESAKKDILLDDGTRHGLKPALLDSESNTPPLASELEMQQETTRIKSNSPFARVDSEPAHESTRNSYKPRENKSIRCCLGSARASLKKSTHKDTHIGSALSLFARFLPILDEK